MAYIFVDKFKKEYASVLKPKFYKRFGDYKCPNDEYVRLKKGTIKAIVGRDMTCGEDAIKTNRVGLVRIDGKNMYFFNEN